MDPSSIALQGLDQASLQLDYAANNIAVSATAPATPAGQNPAGENQDTVTLSDDMLGLLPAQNAFSANLATLTTAQQTEQSLLDVIA